LEYTLILNAEEAFWTGRKSAEGVLKDLITGDTMPIERKGISTFTYGIGLRELGVDYRSDAAQYACFRSS
jgi:hypothetical protein